MADYCGAFADISPTDMGIKVAREVLAAQRRARAAIGSVITGNMAPGDYFQYFLPRHIGMYAGVPQDVPALNVQRICGTGFELFRQAGDQIARGYTDCALVVGTESMTRNPIAAFNHRSGFKLGAPVEFKDYMWEALYDPAAGVTMPQTAENLAKKYGITRATVDEYASLSFERARAGAEDGFFAGEIVPVVTTKPSNWKAMPRASCACPARSRSSTHDTHARPSPVEVLAKLRPLYPDGVQTGGNSSALVDAAAAAIVASGSLRARRKPLARIVATATVGVPPEIMGIGPAPAIRLLLERSGLRLDDIDAVRDQRSAGRADRRGRARTGPGPGAPEHPRRRDRAGPPAGRDRRAPDRHGGARAAPAQGALWRSPRPASAAARASPSCWKTPTTNKPTIQ
jgi:acetyl-CoA C-acetyltransferase